MTPGLPPHVATGDRATTIGLAPLLRMAFAGVDLTPIKAALVARAERDLADANALLDLSTLLHLTFDHSDAAEIQAGALAQQQIYRLTPPAGETRLRLLTIKGPGDLMSNTPLECLLDGSHIAQTIVYAGPGLPFPEAVPDHDVLFVAVGENDGNRALLEQLDLRLRSWPRPVLNRPSRILATSRDAASGLLATAPGVVMPVTRRVDRSSLPDVATCPVVIRPADSHAGHGLVKVDGPAAIAAYLAQRAEPVFYVTPFVDYRGRDGLFRKYRVVLIDGRPFVCHVGISDHWMVHYANAGMVGRVESAEKRAEEARIMAGFDDGFGRRHAEALGAINARIGLDYLGIDCAEAPDGRLLVFEVDSAMVVHDMDPVDLFPYKPPQMRKIFAAFQAMLTRRRASRYAG